jgi:carbonic anhydrase
LYFEGHSSFTYEIKDAKDDAVTKNYANQKNVPVAVVADTTKVTLNTNPTDEPNPGVNHYTSEFAKTVFGTNSNQWDALQFHMHSPSEHTINGDYYDLEMHTVHVPKGNTAPADGGNGFIASAMGLVFSVDKFTADLTFAQQQVIDIFFDSMKWDAVGESPTVDIVAYGSLMEMADFNNRWVYKGSVTTPPCNINVYWNVLSTIYPI